MPEIAAKVLRRLSRRDFLRVAPLLCAPAWCRSRRANAAAGKLKLSPELFSLGVASGDPVPDGVVLWTRLAPHPLEGGGMPAVDVPVRWELAHDEAFRDLAQSGTTQAPADLAHAVHVEVTGLQPDRVYWYRFIAGGEASPVGRTRTYPRADVIPEHVRFAFASCQSYEFGYFNAYEHLAREDLHLVLHLGDYIYEGPGQKDRLRPHPGGTVRTLADYRRRYALYKSEPELQAAHAAFPWVVTWDDHEFHNNCAGASPAQEDEDPVAYLQRRANAYQAYYEHLPLRRPQTPAGPHLQLYRQLDYGRLLRFAVLDTRQYRTHQPCGDGNKPPCAGAFDPQATMLGDRQEKWLQDVLQQSSTTWNVLAQQVMMARVDRKAGEEIAFSMDQWPGYEVARQRLLSFLSQERIANPVVLTGDIHSNWVNDLQVDSERADAAVVATEFVGTSISSGGDGGENRPYRDSVMAENPFTRFYNSERGYVRCDVTPREWTTDFRVVDTVTRRGAECRTRVSFRVEAGHPGADQA